ncbi:MAG TPA: DUF4870 domain-containing protein [Opitutaceae bacterium]|nr:DUF4870 domain-containing protein [Opitutaceae bacterium]
MENVPSATPTPAPSLASNDRLWAVLCHISSLLGVGFVLPLVVYLVMKKDSPFVAENAREALNFHISIFIYSLCAVPFVFILIGIPLLIAIGLGALVLAIIAAVKSSEGTCYRYPLTIRLVS